MIRRHRHYRRESACQKESETRHGKADGDPDENHDANRASKPGRVLFSRGSPAQPTQHHDGYRSEGEHDATADRPRYEQRSRHDRYEDGKFQHGEDQRVAVGPSRPRADIDDLIRSSGL